MPSEWRGYGDLGHVGLGMVSYFLAYVFSFLLTLQDVSALARKSAPPGGDAAGSGPVAATPAASSEWVETVTEAEGGHKVVVYYNVRSRVTQYEPPPEGYVSREQYDALAGGQRAASGVAAQQAPQQAAGSPSQGTTLSAAPQAAQGAMQQQQAPAPVVNSEWSEHWSAEYGIPYYYNRLTQQTVWEPPQVPYAPMQR